MGFYDPVNTVKVMSSRLVNLLKLFLCRLRHPKRLTSTKCSFFRLHNLNIISGREGGNGRRNYFVISLYKSNVTGPMRELVTS